MNFTILIGRITKVPELNEVQANGKLTSVTKNTIAVKRPFKNSNGEYESDFFDFTLWGSTAEFLVNYAEKGSVIVLKGRIQNRKFNDKTITEIVGENVEILSTPASSVAKPKEQASVVKETNPFESVDTGKISNDDLPF